MERPDNSAPENAPGNSARATGGAGLFDRGAQRALAVMAVAFLLFLAWVLSNMLLLAFAALLIAVLLRHCANFIARHTPLGPRMGLGVVALIAVLLGWLFVTTLGPRIASEFDTLARTVPDTIESVAEDLQDRTWGRYLINSMAPSENGEGFNIFGTIGGTLSSALSVGTSVLVLIAVAIFLALDPGIYRQGVLHLVPFHRRARVREVLDTLGDTLWKWLQGQLIDMLAVALLTGLGLWLVGVPLAVTLGLIAGLTNFIPYVGPFLSGIPATLIAFSHEPQSALWAAGVFLVVQQVEGNILMPVIQKHVAALPPVLCILAIVAFGVLFGFIGILVATPLMLALMVTVRMLYVEDMLGDYSAKGGVPQKEDGPQH